MYVIKLTPEQFEAADWAIDGMKDCEAFCDEELAKAEYGHLLPLPEFDSGAGTETPNLLVPDDVNTIADFLYRLEEQAFDMSDAPPAWKRTAQRLAEKIRAATKFDGRTY